MCHKCFAYAHMNLIIKLSRKNLVIEHCKMNYEKEKLCDAFQLGKQTKTSFRSNNLVITNRCLKLIHMYLFGPSRTRNLGNHTSCLVMVDDYSQYT